MDEYEWLDGKQGDRVAVWDTRDDAMEVLDALGWREVDTVLFSDDHDGYVIRDRYYGTLTERHDLPPTYRP